VRILFLLNQLIFYLEGVEGIETLEEEHLPDDTGVVNSDKDDDDVK
jgi:hypothetical protein